MRARAALRVHRLPACDRGRWRRRAALPDAVLGARRAGAVRRRPRDDRATRGGAERVPRCAVLGARGDGGADSRAWARGRAPPLGAGTTRRVLVTVEGADLPGRRCGPSPEGGWYETVHVGLCD